MFNPTKWSTAIGSGIALLALTIPSSTFAQSEMHNCDGVWKSQPCDSPKAATEEQSSDAALKAAEEIQNLTQKEVSKDDKKKAMSAKRTLVHDLTMKSIEAKREHKVSVPTAAAEDFCLKSDSSLDDCEERVNKILDRIDSKIKDSELVKEEKQANKLAKEQNKLLKERNEIESNKPTVVVNQQQRHPYRRGFYFPDQVVEQNSAGVSATVSGNVGGAETQVQVNSSTTTTYPHGSIYIPQGSGNWGNNVGGPNVYKSQGDPASTMVKIPGSE